MIKSIIFDLGGVILTHKVEMTMKSLAETFQIDEEKSINLFKKFEDDWVTGKITGEQLVNNFKKEFKSKQPLKKILKHWVDLYNERTNLNEDLIDFIDKLRRKYKIYLLTNTTDIHHNLNSTRGIFEHFDRVFPSFIVGKRKPNSDFYEHVLEEIQLKSQECIFIDDREENLKVPKSLGMKTILFKDNKNFTKALAEFGI